MSRRTLLVVIAALALIGGLTFTAAELWVAPGHPTPGHQAIAGDCFACHQPFRGTPVERCTACHAFDRDGVVDGRQSVPANGKITPGSPFFALHRDASGRTCTNCHTGHLTREMPSATTFDHSAWFPLAPPHDAACTTCHVSGDYARYTCTNCHEHSPDRLAREHAEEGITDLRDCVRCHRSGREHGEGHGDRRERED